MTLSDLIAQANLAEIVGQWVTLRPVGTDWRGLCPFHKEKTPSFRVHAAGPYRNTFKCFGCGKGGGVVDFLVFMNRGNRAEAAQWLAEYYQTALDRQPRVEPAVRTQSALIAVECRQFWQAVYAALSHYSAALLAISQYTWKAWGLLQAAGEVPPDEDFPDQGWRLLQVADMFETEHQRLTSAIRSAQPEVLMRLYLDFRDQHREVGAAMRLRDKEVRVAASRFVAALAAGGPELDVSYQRLRTTDAVGVARALPHDNGELG